MPNREQTGILENNVFALTPKGQAELRGAGTSLSAAEIEILVLIDGQSTVAETAERSRMPGVADVLAIFRKLAHGGWVEKTKAGAGPYSLVDFFESGEPVSPSAAATARAKRATAATTQLLQQQGYFVRIARRAGAASPPGQSGRHSILVIEDEPVLARMLKHVLEAEGFSVRNAMNRAQIVAELRQPPRPDLVLLDVMLPDVDGFEVLLKIRQHPALKTLPVVMLTSKATRAAVLEGLACGANGYITKPFEIPVLLTATNAVLGLSGAAPRESGHGAPPAPAPSVLDLIKQKVSSKKQAEEQLAGDKLERQKALFKRISTALMKVYKYFTELAEQLNQLNPLLPKAYSLHNIAEFEQIAWQAGARTNCLTRKSDSEEKIFNKVTLDCKFASQKQFEVVRDILAHEKVKMALEEAGISYRKTMTKSDRGYADSATFYFPCEVSAGLIFSCDDESGKLVLTTRNVERFGTMVFEFDIEALDQTLLDQLTLMLLGEKHSVGKLIKRTA